MRPQSRSVIHRLNGSSAIGARPARPAPWSEPLALARGWALFVREALARPREIGAVVPSSPALARRMAALTPVSDGTLVIELGAGTGVVTAALLDRGVDPHRLIAIERSAALADLLRHRFPAIRVVCGDAAEIRRLTRRALAETTSVQVVSSLPLRSLPPAKVRAILREVHSLLRPGVGQWIQYTYAITRRQVPEGFQRRETCVIWQNVPPARIDVFVRTRAA